MSDKIWNLATGNDQFINNTHQYPEKVIAFAVNRIMQAIISMMWLFLYGNTLDVIYKNGDWVRMSWVIFKYEPLAVHSHDGIYATAMGHFIIGAAKRKTDSGK